MREQNKENSDEQQLNHQDGTIKLLLKCNDGQTRVFSVSLFPILVWPG